MFDSKIYLRHIIIAISVIVISKLVSGGLLPKCNLQDASCKKNLYGGIIRSIAGGVPDKGIPAIDSIKVKNIVAPVSDSVQMTLVDGHIDGFKNFEIVVLETLVSEHHTISSLLCNIAYNGEYKISVTNSFIKELGGNANGVEDVVVSGNGKVSLDKLAITIEFPFTIKKDDGEIYLKIKPSNIISINQTLEKITFSSDDIVLGDKDTTEKIISYLNENSNRFQAPFLTIANEQVLIFFRAFADYFFNKVPAKNFIDDDLTNLVEE